MICLALRGAADNGTSVFVATHDPDVIALADNVIDLDSGVTGAPLNT